jgi:hypothetical protein
VINDYFDDATEGFLEYYTALANAGEETGVGLCATIYVKNSWEYVEIATIHTGAFWHSPQHCTVFMATPFPWYQLADLPACKTPFLLQARRSSPQ